MRIAHLSDIHWNLRPPLGRVLGKRLLGTANLVLGGRGAAYSNAVQLELVRATLAVQPDVVVISGDLTQTALQEEFEWARRDLQPLLDAVPTFIVPGNHDVYTRGAKSERRIQQFFGDWMHLREDGLGRLDLGDVTLLGLDPCRPTPLSSGWLPKEQLAALANTLADPDLATRQVVIVIHYPLIHSDGRPYDGLNHGLRNARDLLEVLGDAPSLPRLVLHGHKHHAAALPLRLPDGNLKICNAGSGGYAHQPPRVATFQVYDLDADSLIIRRFAHNGTSFEELGQPL